MRSASLAVPLLFALAASAQTRFPVPPSQPPSLADAAPSGCRLHLSASQRGTPATIWTISREDDADPQIRRQLNLRHAGYGVHVRLEPSPLVQMPPRFLRVNLAVDYLPPATRLVPVNAHGPATQRKTFTLASGTLPVYHLDGDLLVGQVSGITSVRILSFVDANGNIITEAPDCAVVPSLYVPVTN